MKDTWNIEPSVSDDIVANLLKKRGIENSQDQEKFLNPDWNRDTFDPMTFKNMEDAVARVFLALEKSQKIVIHGDYDADGVCGSTLLFSCLKIISEKLEFEPKIEVFLPDRERDGYGVAMHTIERLGEEGTNLLITVDCGIANVDQLDRAHDLGVDSIICDHHQLADRLPEYSIILHPLAPGEDYPNKFLCGTGVAFKFASALITEARSRGADLPEGYEKWFLDLVAIATVTDVMPLIGESRVLEKFGLQVLNKTRRPGLRKIIELSRTQLGSIDTQAIGFRIGPRLNAAGRIKSAEVAFKALSADTEEDAQKFAEELELLNRERRRISEAAYKEARSIVKERDKAPIHVVWSETWMPGIVGLVAGKIVNDFGIPAFALTKVGDRFVGSGRSIGGLHLVEAMRSCGDIFVESGGHPQACGLTLASIKELELFQERVTKFAQDYFGAEGSKKVLEIDAELSLDEVTWDLYKTLEQFEPFGERNSRPLFLARNVQILSARAIGAEGKHLSLTANQSEGSIQKMIGFGFGSKAEQLPMGSSVDVVFEVNENTWKGNTELQLRIVDLDIL